MKQTIRSIGCSVLIGVMLFGGYVRLSYCTLRSTESNITNSPFQMNSQPGTLVYRIYNKNGLNQFIDETPTCSLDEVVVITNGKKKLVQRDDAEFEGLEQEWRQIVVPEYPGNCGQSITLQNQNSY